MMKRTALYFVAAFALACSPSEPPKNAEPTPSASASTAEIAPPPSASAAVSTAPSASAAPSAVASVAPPPAALSFHAIPLGQTAEITVPAAGKVTYVQFCASWCVPCAKLLPIAQKLFVKYKDKGFTAVAVEVDDAKADVAPFAKKQGVTFPVIWDEGQKLSSMFKVQTMPTGYVLGKRGNTAYVQRGFVDGDEATIEKEIVAALAQGAQ